MNTTPEKWFPANFCPRDAHCSMENALAPSNGHKIQSMVYSEEEDSALLCEIRHFADGKVPVLLKDFGWEKCDGKVVPIATFVEAFSIIGGAYGGDERDSFGLPDLSDTKDGEYYIALRGDTPGFVGP